MHVRNACRWSCLAAGPISPDVFPNRLWAHHSTHFTAAHGVAQVALGQVLHPLGELLPLSENFLLKSLLAHPQPPKGQYRWHWAGTDI